MVEVIVSAVLLIVLAMATLPLLDQAGQRSGTNKSRGIASSLAQADQDRMRQMSIDNLANFTDSRTKTVEGIGFKIDSEARWVRDASGFVTCAVDPARAEYVKIMSTVTWPKMFNTKPVVVESFVAPGVTALGPGKGTLTVKLQTAAGNPQPGVPVSTGGLSGVTDSGGCYVFAQVNAGANTLTFNQAGFVDRKHANPSTQSVSVAGGATSQVTDMYDRAITLRGRIRLDDTPGGDPDSTWSTMTAKPGDASVLTRTDTPPSPTTTANVFDLGPLFPSTTGYGVYAGKQSCAMNDPTQYYSNYFTDPKYKSGWTNTYQSAPITTPVTVFMRRISVTVSGTGAFKYGISVKPAGTGSAGCEALGRRSPATAATSYTQDFDVPWGQYRICVDNGTGAGARMKDLYNSTPFNNTPAGSVGANAPTATPVSYGSFPAASPWTGTTSGTCPA
jgi:hypothetical protein